MKIIKSLLFNENLLGVFRNFSEFSIRKKVLASIIMTGNLVVCFANGYLRGIRTADISDAVYLYTTIGNTIAVLVLSFITSKITTDLLKKLTINDSYFKRDVLYNLNLERIRKITLIAGHLFCLCKVATFIYFSYFHHLSIDSDFYKTFGLYAYIILDFNMILSSYRNTYEYLVLYVLLFTMSEQLKAIIRTVEAATITMKEESPNNECLKFDEWSSVYSNINDVSKCFNSVFGTQLTIMLGMIIFYYMFFEYAIASESIKGTITVVATMVYATVFLLFITTIAILSRAGAEVQNKADTLKRRICRLLMVSLKNEQYYKATKDLLRLVSTRPVRSRALGFLDIDMSLLPKCLMYFTYYTVIALQFNNVV